MITAARAFVEHTTIARSDRDGCTIIEAETALNTIEILLIYTVGDTAWEIIEPALEVLHEALRVARAEARLPPRKAKAW
jgi:hypothetical protein